MTLANNIINQTQRHVIIYLFILLGIKCQFFIEQVYNHVITIYGSKLEQDYVALDNDQFSGERYIIYIYNLEIHILLICFHFLIFIYFWLG